ncbi:ferrochelatase [Paracidovorax valerianellae]|uniref:Ferrochelatase n=1 Tax=Paracidovorax valerianellae TaxID=187868 RepID=A0A1G6JMM7_9BURK|nr:ferrochelatase [Paracidovorax valerianellae]MDA8445318.1 ferrochelatase [Paracidovorax valerianellae]SDC19963.1 ferrochelatase [Paracidovorax valerianellae]
MQTSTPAPLAPSTPSAPAHQSPARVPRAAVLLCNLGTPEAPTAPALRRYLAQFLGDPRVVEIPRAAWLPILHGIILRIRPAKSAAKYASVWMPEGSPLAVWTARQATLLRGWLGEAGLGVPVRHAMRYGQPSIASQLDALQAEGIERVLVLPLYPQYSSTTTASVADDVYTWAGRQRRLLEFRFVNSYHAHPGYIDALAQSVRAHWKREGSRAEQLVMSFHGIPARNVQLGDPYQQECLTTATLVAEALGLSPDAYRVTFQSRFGKARWLEPYTEPTLIEMAQAGTRSVDVMCPGFPCDCLETLEEINQEAREAFLHAGGKEFRYIPCMNDDNAWITGLSQIAQQHLQGWDRP